MEQYIIVYSRYVILFLMALYTLLALYLVFAGFGGPGKGKAAANIQSGLIFLIQFVAFLTICVEKGTIDYLFFYAFAQLVLFASMTLFLMIYPGINRLILNNMCLLLGTGLIILTRLELSKAVKQLVIAAVSLAVSMAVPALMKRFDTLLTKLTWLYAGLGVAALGVVLVLGQVTHGSRISYTIGGITFQPSEFVKLLFVFYIAAMLWEEASLWQLFICAAFSAAQVLILVLSRDLGSALIFYAAFVFMVFFATGKYRYLLFGGAAGAGAACVAYRVFSHVQVRVQAWRDPWSVIDDQGFQITQSLFALSRGSWFGLGIGQGTPKDIPYVETDFIFAAVTEEMGICFSVCLILVCISTFLAFFRVAAAEEDRFLRLIASGFGVMYIFQIFLTIGGGTKFIPLTGVTLPFISYGGSSVMSTFLLFAVVQSICMKQSAERGPDRWEEDEEDYEDDYDWEEEDGWEDEE